MRETYEIDTVVTQIREAAQALRARGMPKRGGKTDVLRAARDEIIALLRDGYSASQIADMIKDATQISVLPRAIRTVAEMEAPKQTRGRPRKEKTSKGRQQKQGAAPPPVMRHADGRMTIGTEPEL